MLLLTCPSWMEVATKPHLSPSEAEAKQKQHQNSKYRLVQSPATGRVFLGVAADQANHNQQQDTKLTTAASLEASVPGLQRDSVASLPGSKSACSPVTVGGCFCVTEVVYD